MKINESLVAVGRSKIDDYPSSPYSPKEIFPEFKNFIFPMKVDKANYVYSLVREILYSLELDKNNFGKKSWNPFVDIVMKGDHIVIKPNLVKGHNELGYDPKSIVTHASVIRPIIDYLLLATNGDCKITICDVPLQQSNWEDIKKVSGLDELIDFYKKNKIDISLLDLRGEISYTNEKGIIVDRIYKVRDPLGYATVDLGERSCLTPIIKHSRKLEITDYGKGTVPPHHNKEKNEYYICKTVLDADLFINIPKLKTHRKAGITCSLKNLIGINGDKRWIAHHRRGPKSYGGDEFRTMLSLDQIKLWSQWHIWAFLKRHKILIPMTNLVNTLYFYTLPLILRKVKKKQDTSSSEIIPEKYCDADEFPQSEGSWYGNDTLWRCIVDLNKVLFYSNKKGVMQKTRQRKYLTIVDAIIAGEKEGPLEPTPKKIGTIIGGFNPTTVDFVAAKVMGFDYRKIPQIREAFNNAYWPIYLGSPHNIKIKYLNNKSFSLFFIPSKGWVGHIEKEINSN